VRSDDCCLRVMERNACGNVQPDHLLKKEVIKETSLKVMVINFTDPLLTASWGYQIADWFTLHPENISPSGLEDTELKKRQDSKKNRARAGGFRTATKNTTNHLEGGVGDAPARFAPRRK